VGDGGGRRDRREYTVRESSAPEWSAPRNEAIHPA
jgi:hypothetical protein